MRYLILGASASGVSCAKTLRQLDLQAEIIMVSKDNDIYSRCMLHHIISKKRDVEALSFVEKDFIEKNNINWIKGVKVEKIYVDKKAVFLDNGETLSYDKVLIATGSSSFIPPVKNLREGKRVYGLRNIEDAITIRDEIENINSVVVLGAGLVGLDAVVGLLERKTKISLVEMADRILPLQLDKYAASRYEELLEKHGVDVYTGIKAQEAILDEGKNVKGIKLSNGTIINCDMIIVAAGVRPNIDFIEENTINIDKGIVINNRCETNIMDVYAAGDVCGKSPIWPLAVKQGIVAAHNMAGIEMNLDDFFGLRNSMNFLGLETVSLGLIEAPDDSFKVVTEKYKDNYKKVIYKDGIIYGAIIQGDISYCGVLTYLIKNKIDVGNIEKGIFDIGYSDFFSLKENGEYKYAI